MQSGSQAEDRQNGKVHRLTSVAANALWHVPGRFAMARLLGGYSLRCVLFHNIADQDSSFTRGISVNVSRKAFEAKLQFLVRNYKPVNLEQVLQGYSGAELPSRAVLVTFDDAYASIAAIAAPLCAKYGVPAVFFVNAAFVDNRRMAVDNLLCFVNSEFGFQPIAHAAREVGGNEAHLPQSLTAVFQTYFPAITLVQREAFIAAVIKRARIDEAGLASKARLYVTAKDLRDLTRYGVDIGNHTFSHVHCRSLTAAGRAEEIGHNKEALEQISRKPVRVFSVPYGKSADLTPEVARYLRESGHDAVFLSESVANRSASGAYPLDRVSTQTESDARFFAELEIYPRLRAFRNRWLHPKASEAEYMRASSNPVVSDGQTKGSTAIRA